MIAYASCSAIRLLRRRRRRGPRGCSRRGRRWSRGGFPTKNLIHHSAASRAFALNGLAPILGRHLHRIDDLFFGLAFNAISFRHNWYPWADAPRTHLQGPSKLWGGSPGRQRENLLLRNALLRTGLHLDRLPAQPAPTLHAPVCCRSDVLSIFPVAFRGKAGMKTILRGTL